MDFDLKFMSDMAQTAASAAGSVRQAAEAFTALKGLSKSPEKRSEAEVEAAMAKVALAIDNARLSNQLLEAQVVMLTDNIRKANEAQAQLERYQLWETPAGNFVYRLKDTDAAGEPAHLICPNCHADGRRSILQGDRHIKRCKVCKTSFDVEPWPSAQGPAFQIY